MVSVTTRRLGVRRDVAIGPHDAPAHGAALGVETIDLEPPVGHAIRRVVVNRGLDARDGCRGLRLGRPANARPIIEALAPRARRQKGTSAKTPRILTAAIPSF